MNGTQSFFGFIGRVGIALFFLVTGAVALMNISTSASIVAEAFRGLVQDNKIILSLACFLAFLQILAALFILFGYWARAGALGLAVGCVIVTMLVNIPELEGFNIASLDFRFHLTAALKNAAIVGGLLYVVATGTGDFSLGRQRQTSQ